MTPRLINRWTLLSLALLLAAAVLSWVPASSVQEIQNNEPGSLAHLDQVIERGELIMLTRNGASSYFIDADGPTGPEYELARGFADRLGVELKVTVADSFSDLATLLEAGEGDLIAANLSRTDAREVKFRFGPAYAETRALVVYRKGLRRPESVGDLEGLRGAVLADSSYQELMHSLPADSPALTWEAQDNVGVEDLLHAVAEGELEYTLVDQRIYQVLRRYYPGVRQGFLLGPTQSLAWAFQRNNDDSLAQAAGRYLTEAREQGALVAIQDQFFDTPERLGQVDMMLFQDRLRQRLPQFMPFFQEAANSYDLDWRLLAAMGYQESHWDPLAASPTGVRGVMMLTQNTAKSLGVTDRLDPEQSILGGADYVVRLRERLPERIEDPDRTWLALAAYNIGMAHLEDARRLTEAQGGNPDRWSDVRERLPLLTQEKFYRQTRYGYARGHEARSYVDNIQRFYDTLVWMDTRSHPLLASEFLTAP